MPKPSSGAPAAPLYGLVFLSGAAGLTLEIVWIRALGLSLGTSTRSIATVVTAYMLGIALGSALLGRAADRHPHPVRLYSRLELAIAVSSLAVSAILLRASSVLVAVERAAGVVWLPHALQLVVRGALALALLLVPTTLMGGTVPVLTRALARTGAPGRVVGVLYAANTAGAVLGALLPDVAAIPHLGMLATAACASLADLLVAAAAQALPSAETTPPTSPIPIANTLAARRRAIFVFAVSGFCALGYELAWSRIIENLVGGFAVGFAILLAVYLVAIAAGSGLGARLVARATHPLPWACLALAGSALAMLVPVVTLAGWRDVVGHHLPAAVGTPHAAWIQLRLVRYLALVSSLILEGASALLMGLGLPFLAAAAVPTDAAGRATGDLYLANTLAGAAGSVVTGFVLIPRVGLQTTIALLAAVAAVGAIVGVLERKPSWRLAPVIALSLAVAVACFRESKGHLDLVLLHLPVPPLALAEGSTTVAAAVPKEEFGVEVYRYLAQPGVDMSDTSFGARRYMGLMGHLPLLFSGLGPRDALLICYGVGNTARSLLSHPELTHLDVVDTAPEVLRLSPVFAAESGSDPLRDPRTRVTIDDGRFFLAASERTYDVITAEPPPPTWAGVGNLYSREYYAAARHALRPGGVLAQWLPRFQLTPEALRSVVAALAGEFPYVGLFCGNTEEWILLGSDHPLTIDLQNWSQRLAAPSVQADLIGMGIQSAEELAATYMQTSDGLRRAVAGAPPVTDDLPLLQYPTGDITGPWAAPDGMVAESGALLPLIHADGAASSARLIAALDAQRLILQALAVHEYGAAIQSPQFGSLMEEALEREPGRRDVLALLGMGDDDVRAARAALGHDPNRSDAAFTLARRDFSDHSFAAALEELRKVTPDRAHAAQYWSMRSAAEGVLGDGAAAAASYAQFQAAKGNP